MADDQLSLNFDVPLPAGVPTPSAPLPTVASPEHLNAQTPKPLRAPGQAPERLHRPFNYTIAMREVVEDVVGTLPELKHVDLDRVLLSIMQARRKSRHGVYASCCPLRFEGGAPETLHDGRRFRMPELKHEGREVLYIVYFMLPRFHDEQDYHGKLATVIHELYHVSPLFNGDIRRFPGKNFAHGESREDYHRAMCHLATRYMAQSRRANDWEFLREPFTQLLKRPGGVIGVSITKPRPYAVDPAPRRKR